tara:strand:- start:114 stop:341 length:228 start_codon:yes stop_codon:yes gene_type:complete
VVQGRTKTESRRELAEGLISVASDIGSINFVRQRQNAVAGAAQILHVFGLMASVNGFQSWQKLCCDRACCTHKLD